MTAADKMDISSNSEAESTLKNERQKINRFIDFDWMLQYGFRAFEDKPQCLTCYSFLDNRSLRQPNDLIQHYQTQHPNETSVDEWTKKEAESHYTSKLVELEKMTNDVQHSNLENNNRINNSPFFSIKFQVTDSQNVSVHVKYVDKTKINECTLLSECVSNFSVDKQEENIINIFSESLKNWEVDWKKCVSININNTQNIIKADSDFMKYLTNMAPNAAIESGSPVEDSGRNWIFQPMSKDAWTTANLPQEELRLLMFLRSDMLQQANYSYFKDSIDHFWIHVAKQYAELQKIALKYLVSFETHS